MLVSDSDSTTPNKGADEDIDSRNVTNSSGLHNSFKTPIISTHVNITDKNPDATQKLREILHIQDALHPQAQRDNKSTGSNSSTQNSTNESQTCYSSLQSSYSNGSAEESRLAQLEAGQSSLASIVQLIPSLIQQVQSLNDTVQQLSITVQQMWSLMQGPSTNRDQQQQEEIENIIQNENAAHNAQVQHMPYSQQYGHMNPVGYSQNTTAPFYQSYQQQQDLQHNNHMPMQPAAHQQQMSHQQGHTNSINQGHTTYDQLGITSSTALEIQYPTNIPHNQHSEHENYNSSDLQAQQVTHSSNIGSSLTLTENSLTTTTKRVNTRSNQNKKDHDSDKEDDRSKDDQSNNSDQQQNHPPTRGSGGTGPPDDGGDSSDDEGDDNNSNRRNNNNRRGTNRQPHPQHEHHSTFIVNEDPIPSLKGVLTFTSLQEFSDEMESFNYHDSMNRNIPMFRRLSPANLAGLHDTLEMMDKWTIADITDPTQVKTSDDSKRYPFSFPSIGDHGDPVPWNPKDDETLNHLKDISKCKDNRTILSNQNDHVFLSLCAVHLKLGRFLKESKYEEDRNYFTHIFKGISLGESTEGWRTVLRGIPRLITFVDLYGAYTLTEGNGGVLTRYPPKYYKARIRAILEELLKTQWKIKRTNVDWKANLKQEWSRDKVKLEELCYIARKKLPPSTEEAPKQPKGTKQNNNSGRQRDKKHNNSPQYETYGVDKAATGAPIPGDMCWTCGFGQWESKVLPQEMKDKVRNKLRELCSRKKGGCRCPTPISEEDKLEAKKHRDVGNAAIDAAKKKNKSNDKKPNRRNRRTPVSAILPPATTTVTCSTEINYRLSGMALQQLKSNQVDVTLL